MKTSWKQCCAVAMSCVAMSLAWGIDGNVDRVSVEQIPSLLAQLGAATFAEREDAQEKLVQLGCARTNEVLDSCLRTHVSASDPEVAHRTRTILEQVVTKTMFDRPHGYLGVSIRAQALSVNNGTNVNAIVLQSVIEESSAANAGLWPGDIVVKLDDEPMLPDATTDKFIRYIQSKRPGDVVMITVIRLGSPHVFQATLGEMPETIREQFYSADKKRPFFETWLEQSLEKLKKTSATK